MTTHGNSGSNGKPGTPTNNSSNTELVVLEVRAVQTVEGMEEDLAVQEALVECPHHKPRKVVHLKVVGHPITEAKCRFPLHLTLFIACLSLHSIPPPLCRPLFPNLDKLYCINNTCCPSVVLSLSLQSEAGSIGVHE